MEIKQAVVALAALAQETRLSAFRALVAAGEAGLPAGEIAARLGVASTTLSFHLKELTYSGLVTSRSDFRAMRALLDYLSEECCGGRPELCLSNPPTGGPSR
jgi:DNA-binding transcriptional ArsR family regulator